LLGGVLGETGPADAGGTEGCRDAAPSETLVGDENRHRVACYRATDDDEYWDSSPLDGAEL